MADLTDRLNEIANSPAQATADGVSTTELDLEKLIKLDQYQKALAGSKTKSRGLRFTKLIPPGPRDGGCR